jgi:hypothetical protein
VETASGKARTTVEEWLEGSGDEVVAIDGGANLRGEDEFVFLPESSNTPQLLELNLAMLL